MSKIPDAIPQAAALPIRGGHVCLITSSTGKRWIIPKGHREPGHTLAQTALQEAWEEAGLRGDLRHEPIGWYAYSKNDNLYRVTVYVMDVTQAARKWPESGHRQRRWLTPAEALELLEDPGLCELVEQFVPELDRDVMKSAASARR